MCIALRSYTRGFRAPSSSAQRAQGRRLLLVMASQDFKVAAPLGRTIKVVGMGSCGVDYLASVAAYPKPDEKLRTEQLEVQGGGNAANALTAAARLGLKPVLVTKIGADGLGDGIITELEADGIDTAHVLRAGGHPSPFTYIIVDRSGGTRTCIHTPGANLEPSEITQAALSDILKGAALVYFDGRLTEAALVVAGGARAAGIPVLVEAERLRPNLEQLLAYADVVVTSAHFPSDWTGEKDIGDALMAVAARLPFAHTIITTRGVKGAVMLERAAEVATTADGAQQQALSDVVSQLEGQLGAAGSSTDCVSKSGVVVKRGTVARSSGPVSLVYTPAHNAAAAVAAAQGAAARAAALNADKGNTAGYAMGASGASTAHAAAQGLGLVATVTVASCAGLPQGAVVDTTGAGDAFIGSVVYGLATGMAPSRILTLASVVAACKCTALGARPGLPQRSQLATDLLQ